MVPTRLPLMAAMAIAGILFLSAGAAAASGIQAALGEEVVIEGYATSGPYVYLFLTGPNLPENGVALNDITKRADQGGFTKVSVDGNDHWRFKWQTNSLNGRLDEGTYTVWVVSGPNDRSRLAEADYRTISVTLGKPFVTVDTPAPSGGMDLKSVPDGASLTVNGEYRGKTPLTLQGLSAGTYAITFSRSGFEALSSQVRVEQGKISEVYVTLRPDTGTLAVSSTPPGARILLDGTPAGVAPLVIANLSAGNHTVSLEQDGYRSVVREVTVAAGQVSPVDITLEPLPVPTTTRAAGPVAATAGACAVILLGMAYRKRNS